MLGRIKNNLEIFFPEAQITLKEKILKLQVTTVKAQIKIEVNQINRGIIDETVKLSLCKKTQEEFDAFCAISVVSLGNCMVAKFALP